MATFEGTIQEWHAELGPRLRNIICNAFRKQRRAKMGRCEHCSSDTPARELQSAHKHGRERRAIADSILEKYLHDGIVRCDISAIMAEILSKHTVDDFLFLCDAHHKEYDKKIVKAGL